MRRTSQLVEQIRRQTENTKIGVADGIDDQDFIEIINDGIRLLQAGILEVYPRAFSKAYFFDTVRGTAEYTLPSDIFLRHRIVAVQYSDTGRVENYRNLNRRYHLERRDTIGEPCDYMLLSTGITLDPIPNKSLTSGVRLFYDPRVPRADIRRTTVSAITIGAGDITALTLDSADPNFNVTDYTLYDEITLVDRVGNIKTSGISHDGVSAGGVVTLPGGAHTLQTGETAAVGDYVVLGTNATTHPQLPELGEDYLTNYGRYRIFGRDSSQDSAGALQDAEAIKQTIISNYADIASDPTEIPITDWTYDMQSEGNL